VPELESLYEGKGRARSALVCSSDPIRHVETIQPPHFQAANYYSAVARGHGGEFFVTMQHPKESAPEPLVIHIDGRGARPEKRVSGAPAVITSRPAPRAG
jgi:hypothetical protein